MHTHLVQQRSFGCNPTRTATHTPHVAVLRAQSTRRRFLCGTAYRVSTHAQHESTTPASVAATDLKARLSQLITRLNNTSDSEPEKLEDLFRLIDELASCNPTPSPAASPLINGRWALVYTVQAAKGGSVSGRESERSQLQLLSDEVYKLTYQNVLRYLPVLAGTAVGRGGGSSSSTLKVMGNFQIINTDLGTVENQVRFSLFGQRGTIDVNGLASIVQPLKRTEEVDTLRVVFNYFNIKVGDNLRVTPPLAWLSPVGYVRTVYLDEELRISKGDKGSWFIARRTSAE